MLYGICNLSIVALRVTPLNSSEMISQVLFGETFKVIESEKEWSKICLSFDNCEGYIDNKQFEYITEELYTKIVSSKSYYSAEIIDFITNNKSELTTIPLGSNLPFYNNNQLKINTKNYIFEGAVASEKKTKSDILKTAFNFLNTPFLWGGKTPFGIDCSGFTQMVYKLCGHNLFRDVKQQSNQGEVLSFIEESEAGDLAFFDNDEGEIIHVGILLNDYHIIHAHGKVRIDTLDHSGIFNANLQKHTHKLRVIKKII
ncbi:C40 family peptidase [Polaribacter sargassicola]|uniref:C40 family peptidase n=1 Tax=Polaribacter sargassicola TaxID=2836891 RepID=UPI001F42241A|nr:C40 family peptidase [Polaribacter sp. DS7-9]MCG1036518.1 C40 family peptidase [Polaribacter sp. DS7-9]